MLPENPSEEIMSLAPWRSPLGKALHLNRSLANVKYLQLATVRSNGHPANRTVVWRGFREDTNELKLITDFRSQKIADIYENPWGEACWYFSRTREQFRLHGKLLLITEETADEALQTLRVQTWKDLSLGARAQFSWAEPGLPRDFHKPFRMELPTPEEILPDFCLLLFDPIAVDHLQLRGDPQFRTKYDRSPGGKWNTIAVNP
jgi:pyridoxamine 5'-phosphate oxidase